MNDETKSILISQQLANVAKMLDGEIKYHFKYNGKGQNVNQIIIEFQGEDPIWAQYPNATVNPG